MEELVFSRKLYRRVSSLLQEFPDYDVYELKDLYSKLISAVISSVNLFDIVHTILQQGNTIPYSSIVECKPFITSSKPCGKALSLIKQPFGFCFFPEVSYNFYQHNIYRVKDRR